MGKDMRLDLAVLPEEFVGADSVAPGLYAASQMYQSTLTTENQEHTRSLNEVSQVNTVHAPGI